MPAKIQAILVYGTTTTTMCQVLSFMPIQIINEIPKGASFDEENKKGLITHSSSELYANSHHQLLIKT